MAGGRVQLAFWHIGHHGRHQRIAQLARDAVRIAVDAEVVFAQHHVRSVLLGAAGGNNDGGLAGLEGVAYFGPGEFLEEDGVGGLGRGGGEQQEDEGGREFQHPAMVQRGGEREGSSEFAGYDPDLIKGRA